ncbi:MAG: anaerobic sulfatase maturase [Hungatella sp.]|nr:anaerobic sulfatase maturase [Hungatella sp.]
MPPLNILIKPASGNCNMRCTYCFYADEQEHRSVSSHGIMSTDTMHKIIDQAMEYADGFCTLAFQGGEPTLTGLDFYKDMADYIQSSTNPKKIRFHYAIQTNGYALNEDWAKFWAQHHYLVGISLDGPKEIHDRYRKDSMGKGTYHRVLSSVRLLENYHVDYNILTVVTAAAARSGQKIYNFFKKNNFQYQQYIECLDPIKETPGAQEYSLTPKRYEVFLKSLFDAWYLDVKAGKPVYNRYFDNLLMILDRQIPESCNMRGICTNQWVIEADGSTYPCDFYALDQWLLGNIREDSFEKMDLQREQSGFIQFSQQIHRDCRSCSWLPLCRGGCRRNREPVTCNSTEKNYFCSAYQGFFEYAYPRLQEVYQNLKIHSDFSNFQ